MPTSSSEPVVDEALQACTSCRRRKRKCDKVLPKCSSCFRRRIVCEYAKPQFNHQTGSTSEQFCHNLLFEDDFIDSSSLNYPTVLFLDPGILQQGQVDMSRVDSPVAANILQLLGDMNDIHNTASAFFAHIHTWMPFISKKRFFEDYLRPSFRSRSDVILLLLSLNLITTLPPTHPRNARTSFYYTVKHLYLELEGSSIFSVVILQAGVLLALYELGHAIYPAAYLSIGACARYAHAIGISVDRIASTKRVLTLVEVEERRRVWWAIIILDRFVSIGCPGRPFATADPSLDDLLPADDTAWDQGTVSSHGQSALSSPLPGHMSKFALLCQAARLLGQVLRYLSSDQVMQDDVWVQLDRTLVSMATASLDVDSPDYDQITFIYSALVALHAPWLYPDSRRIGNKDHIQRAKTVSREITERISSNLVQQQCFLDRSPESMSPWGLFFAYHICRTHRDCDDGISASLPVVDRLKETFRKIDIRWNAAGVYLGLLEAHDIAYNS